MMLATDFYALMGIDLVACAVLLRVTTSSSGAHALPKASTWPLWLSAVLLVGLWVPYGDAGLPLLGFLRGVVSDFSVTSVALAVLFIAQRIGIAQPLHGRETTGVYAAVAIAALVLYPTALGWGDWDAYRLGWAAQGLVVGLALVALLSFGMGFRLLPWLIALALIGWSFGALESVNLWDYLIDPWIAMVSIFATVKMGLGSLRRPVR